MFNKNPLRWIRLQRCLTSFRVCTLILFMNLGTVILIIPIIVGIQQINMNLLNQYFEQFAIQKFMKQSDSNLNQIMSSYVAQFRNTLNRTEKALLDLQKLYLINDKYKANNDPDMCHTQFEDEDSYEYIYQGFCVNIYDVEFLQYDYLPENDSFKTDYNFVSLLNEFLLPLDPSQEFLPDNIYYSKVEREFTAWWPQWNRVQGYHPSKRPWYIDHMAHYNENPSKKCFYSELYQFYATYPVVAITMTCSLLDDQNNLIGILASDMQFLNNQYKHPRLNIMIVNYDGMLIMTSYQNENLANSTVLGSFYEENMTGFNQDDWQQIKNYAQSQVFSSNCQTFPYQSNILCRYNSILNCDIIMSVHNLSSPNFIFILFNNLTDEINQLLMQKNLIDQVKDDYYLNLVIFLSVGLAIILISLIFVWIIFLPLNDLIKHSKAYLKSNSHKLLFRQKEYYLYNFQINGSTSNNVLLRLKLAYKQVYHRISQQKFKKCPQCQIIQKFQYPSYYRKVELQKSNLENMHNDMSPALILKSIILQRTQDQ